MPDNNPLIPQLMKVLDDAHAIDVIIINVQKQTTITDYMVICSGRSSRHVSAIAEQVIVKMKSLGLPLLVQSGVGSSDWALIDFGDFIVHVMQPEARSFYNLEELWQEN